MRKNTVVNQYNLPVQIKKEGKWYLATCPSWSACYVQARSIEEAISEITAVAKTLIEIYNEKNLEIPLDLVKKADSTKTISFTSPLLVAAA